MGKQNIGIFGKNFIINFAVFFLILAISAFFFFREYVNIYKDNTKNTMITSAHLLSTILSDIDDENLEKEYVKNYWQEFSKKNTAINFMVTNNKSEIIGMYPNEEIYTKYAKGHEGKAINASFKLPSGYTYSITFFIKSTKAIKNALSNMPMLWASLLILSFVCSYFTANLIAKPIEMITKEAIRLKDVNEMPGMVSRNDEIGVLQESIYDLHQTLRSSIEDLEIEMKHITKLESDQRYFFASASQEFKAPVASILAVLDNIKDNVTYSPEMINKINDCKLRVMTLEKLIGEIVDMLKYNGKTTIPTETINVLDLVNAVLNECMPLIEKKKIILSRSIDKRINITTNKVMLTRVIMNVLSNAVEHVENGKQIRIWTESDNVYATLHIYNDAKAIPDEMIKKFFDPFFKTDSLQFTGSEHTGLGLYVVQELLNKINIPFDMKNYDRGICFSLKFKVTQVKNANFKF
ncbi:MAG: HAMP domain-containing histidine kinase [Clostridia bacterium]|nr:HAMP domain-containing histidine kinase [Clostridia bacterium]